MVSGPLDLWGCRSCGELVESPKAEMDPVVGYRCDNCGGLYENRAAAVRCDHFTASWRGGVSERYQNVEVGEYL